MSNAVTRKRYEDLSHTPSIFIAGVRTCTKCGETKPQAEFYGKTGRQQRNSRCIPCYRLQQNTNRTARRALPGERNKEYRRDANKPRHRANALLTDIKRRCIKKGLEFNLTVDWLVPRLGICAVTNTPLLLVRDGSNKTHPRAPSVDRIDPTKGYTTDNCQVVCWMYNAARNYHEHRDVVRFARDLIRAEEERSKSASMEEGSKRQH